MNLAPILLVLLPATHAAAPPSAPAAPSIAWPEFFARIGNEGLEYSDALKALEGRRVRLRGYAILNPAVPGGLMLGPDPGAALHDVDEVEVPYDAVGVLWRTSLKVPPVPARPTVEGTLRLGNHTLGGQAVAVLIDDATPVYPASSGPKPH